MKEKLTNRITDFGIVFIAFMALPYNIITFFALTHSEYEIVRYIPAFLGVGIVLLAVFRKRFLLVFKVRFFLLLLLLAAFFSLALGLLDTGSLWFVLIIIYTLFTGKKNHAFYLFITAFIATLITGIFMITKNPYFPFDYGFEDCQWACVAIKIIDFLIIGFLIYYIVRVFIKTIDSYIGELSEKATILEKLNRALQSEVTEKNKNKELTSDLELKNKELTISTLHLVNHTAFENSIIPKLEALLKKCDKVEVRKTLTRLIRDLKRNSNASIWAEFEKRFSEVNTSFYDKLNEKFPQLSKNEKKLCAFVKLNMNTKDIASLLNISTRGVETARYRLRKSMELEHEVSLYQFLEGF